VKDGRQPRGPCCAAHSAGLRWTESAPSPAPPLPQQRPQLALHTDLHYIPISYPIPYPNRLASAHSPLTSQPQNSSSSLQWRHTRPATAVSARHLRQPGKKMFGAGTPVLPTASYLRCACFNACFTHKRMPLLRVTSALPSRLTAACQPFRCRHPQHPTPSHPPTCCTWPPAPPARAAAAGRPPAAAPAPQGQPPGPAPAPLAPA